MKIIENVLSDETLILCKSEIEKNISSDCWKVSSFFWPENLYKGHLGNVFISRINNVLAENILNNIKKNIPSYNKIDIFLYVWDKGSGINLHNDNNHKFGATIYMNPEWFMDWGGLFLYVDSKTKEQKFLIPKFNTMVVNDCKEQHLVTSVSPYCGQCRITLQIWAQ
jgi:Rps23 Pro-64 3,4-dihydroxylase Tpa1-like proline 4-hydroxylase